MPGLTVTVGPFSASTYNLLVSIAAVLSMAVFMWRARAKTGARLNHLADACVAALIAGLIASRLLHVGLNWVYFQDHTAEILQFRSGGLNWHGAVLGGIIGLYAATRWHRLAYMDVLDAAAFTLPIIAFAAWWGCGAAHCSFGAEVDNLSNYPGWLVWEERDLSNTIAPRYAVQPIGMALSGVVLFLLISIRQLRGLFAVALLLMTAMMFGLGSLRGDDTLMVAGLRADQWLDVLFLLFACAVLMIRRNTRPSHAV